MKKFILVMLLFMFSIISFGNENQFMKEIFERKGLNGTFVVYDLKNDKIDYYNLDRANERFYPASSFKIFNTLIGLENGIVKNVDEMFYYYDGSKVFLVL